MLVIGKNIVKPDLLKDYEESISKINNDIDDGRLVLNDVLLQIKKNGGNFGNKLVK